MSKRIISILGVVLATACASSSQPTDTVANALASVRAAEELGAREVPQASLQLQLANDQLNRANNLMADGRNERARYMAQRAVMDAELAIALTREAKARKAADDAKQQLDATQTQEVAP